MSDHDFLGLMAAAGMERSELRTEKHKALLADLEALNAQLAGKPQLTDDRRRELIDQADAAIDSNEKDIAKLREQLEMASHLTDLLLGYDKRQRVQLLRTLATWLDAMSWDARALAAADEMIVLMAEIEREHNR